MKMVKNSALILVVLLACVSGGALLLSSNRHSRPKKEALNAGGSKYVPIYGIEKLRGYRKWIRVNPEPLFLDHEIASLCVTPSPQQVAVSMNNPHDRKFFTVYVNAAAETTMMTGTPPVFPVGSIIVKEKLPSEKSKSPELLTVMIKREAGYDSANGDWEYLVLNGAASQIESRGKLESCQSCHSHRKETDFVFGNYVPDEN